MPRRPPLAALLLAAACTGPAAAPEGATPVEPVNGLSASTLAACRALKAALPDSLVAGVERRPATPESDSTSAYGDPVITVRCGVDEGSERDEPYTFNDVQWAMHDTGATRTWTTRGKGPHVEVVVPDAYSGQAELVGSVAFAVVEARS